MRLPEPLVPLSETIPDHIWSNLRVSAAFSQLQTSLITFGEACSTTADALGKLATISWPAEMSVEIPEHLYSQKLQGL